MVQVLDLGPSKGERLGTALGTGLGQGLQLLIQGKQQRMLERQQALAQQQQRARQMEGLRALGYSPEEATSLVGLDPSIMREVVKQKLETPQRQAFAESLQEILGGPTREEDIKEKVSITKAGLTPEQATKLAGLGLQKQAMQQKQRLAEEAETRKERESIKESATKAQEQLFSLDEMEDSIRSGEVGPLSSAAFSEMLPDIGPFKIMKRALLSPSASKFKTATKSIMTGAKDIFGSRVSNYDAQLFQEMLPQIGRNEEANLAAVKILKDLTESKIEKRKIYDRLQAANPDASIKSILSEANKEYDEYLDRKHDEMINLMEQTVGKSSKPQSKELTADIAQEFLRQAKGDKEKARKIAKQRGYVF